MPILGEDDNIFENFGLYENEISILEEQKIEGDYTNLVSKSSDIRHCIRDNLLGRTP